MRIWRIILSAIAFAAFCAFGVFILDRGAAEQNKEAAL
jgi:hypothetical protein